jgi:hypothetical protein
MAILIITIVLALLVVLLIVLLVVMNLHAVVPSQVLVASFQMTSLFEAW